MVLGDGPRGWPSGWPAPASESISGAVPTQSPRGDGDRGKLATKGGGVEGRGVEGSERNAMKGVNNSEREGERREREKDGKKVDREKGRQWPLRILPSAISKSLLYSVPPLPP